MNTETRLKRLEAAEQIRMLKADYCDLCDAGYPADALSNLFTVRIPAQSEHLFRSKMNTDSGLK